MLLLSANCWQNLLAGKNVIAYWILAGDPSVGQSKVYSSVLTRILPWGSPRAPSAEKQGPCKNIRGTKLLQMVCYMKYLPDPISQMTSS